MRLHTVVTLSLSAALLVGCSSQAAPPTAGSETPDASETTGSAPAQSSDDTVELTCAGFSDVLTIVDNAKTGFSEGRMAEQERIGWYQLATRVLDRLPSDGDDPVEVAVAELQAVAPVPLGGDPTEIGTVEWSDATWTLYQACDAAGFVPPTGSFTGG